ncbi:MAG: hypothetical protein AB7I42_29525 [Bradyrhizobium sp.]|uniref:hypothetical protein n=1 Tax=Bradyrhizobium sp. TaxID=376 RepID=UPI003D0F80CE
MTTLAETPWWVPLAVGLAMPVATVFVAFRQFRRMGISPEDLDQALDRIEYRKKIEREQTEYRRGIEEELHRTRDQAEAAQLAASEALKMLRDALRREGELEREVEDLKARSKRENEDLKASLAAAHEQLAKLRVGHMGPADEIAGD